MYDPEMRKDCPVRDTLGNCSPVGGFCVDAVSNEICEAVHNAYWQGHGDAMKRLRPEPPKKVLLADVAREYYRCFCSKCGEFVGNIHNGKLAESHSKFCNQCGQAVKWDDSMEVK